MLRAGRGLAGGRGHGAVRRGGRRRPRPSGSGWCGGPCADDDLLPAALAMAARAAAAPGELVRRTKADPAATWPPSTSTTPPSSRELEVQLWSMDTPEFAERLAAMQAKITGR